ncbi:MAG TPA: hypothetical protein ENN21_01640 [Spirochaetes bacterium]|nr:hypothetical protein [Spirochaetota bacterium]
MKHRDRVLAALSHEEPDRCPLQIIPTIEFAERLGDRVLEVMFEQDMVVTAVDGMEGYFGTEQSFVDQWGVTRTRVPYTTPFGIGHYAEITGHPLADDGAIDSYRGPDPGRDGLYDEPARLIKEYKGDYYVAAAVTCTIFETAWALRGLEQTLMDFIMNPDLLKRLLDIPYRYHRAVATRLAGMGVDMIWLGDDVGMQHAMMISPALWRKFLKPSMAELIAELKSVNRSLSVAYHSDGYIEPIIPDLIEIGVDVLNPVQPASMDPAVIKKKYGDRLCFWGTIDEQYTLPFGTVEEVKEEVLTRLATVGRGGGLIIGPTHDVQLDTPLENFWALFDTVLNTPYSAL